MSLRRDLPMVLAGALVELALANGAGGLVAVLFGLLLALILPGYAVIAAIYPRVGVAWSERVLLSLGLSFIVTVLGAIVLNLTPWGVGRLGWLCLLGTVTVAGLIVAAMHSRRGNRAGSALPAVEPLPALLCVCAVMLLVGAVLTAQAGVVQDPSASVTQLWMLPGRAVPAQLRVGVNSTQDGRFRIEIWRGTRKLQEWGSIAVSPGRPWQQALPTPAGTGPVEARLYRADQPATPLRVVRLTPSSG